MTYSSEVLVDAPDLYWKLEDVSGTTTPVDSSGNGLNGSINGTISPGFGEHKIYSGLGTSVGLNGTGASNYIKRAYDASLDVGTGDFTFEFLVRSDNPTSESVEVLGRDDSASGNGIAIDFTPSSGAIRIWVGGTLLVGTIRISDGFHHHVVLIRASGVATVYLDAVSEVSSAAGGNTNVGSGVKVGVMSGDYLTLDGEIGHVAWYKHALSEARVLAHFAELPPYPDANQNASGYIYENIGFNTVNTQEAEGFIFENVGDNTPNSQEAQGYVYEEVVPLTMKSRIGIPIVEGS